MALFDFLKNNKTTTAFSSGSYFDTNINDDDLKSLINNSVSVFQNNAGFDDSQIVDAIKAYSNDEGLALALYRFIPIAYCRLFIPEVRYSDEYILFKNENNQQSFLFSADRIYKSVSIESKIRFTAKTSQEQILPILFHSADFKAINEALNKGSELKNLVCSPSYFLQ